MQDLTITYIQTFLHWEDIDANLAMFEEKIWQAAQKTDLIVLPEMFSTGFTMNAPRLAETMNGRTFKWMKQQAAQTKAVITGSYIIKENGVFYNRLFWVQPDGNFDFYDKRHLFTLTGEHEIYNPGNKRIIKNLNGWKICPLVCYDLRFPVWSRNKVQADKENGSPTESSWSFDYDLLIYIANWPSSRSEAWKTLLKARAIENSCYTLGVNITGRDGRGFEYSGDSFACHPLVKMSGEGLHNNGINSFTLSYGSLAEYRSKYPFLQDSDQFELKS